MKRKVQSRLSEWKSREDRKPLIVLGCRQCGKTYSVLEFAEHEYDDHVFINLEQDLSRRSIFDGDLSADLLVERIMLSFNKEYVPGRTLIVLDEIQVSSGALSSLKAFAFSGIKDVVATGSFLGVYLGDGSPYHESPVGYVDIEQMHPMDFEEFCWAMGVNDRILRMVAEDVSADRRVDGYFDRVMSDLFRTYVSVGGMPEAVRCYAKTKDYRRVRDIQQNIMLILKNDAGKYSERADRDRIVNCLDSIPMQLSSDKGRFEFGAIPKSKAGYGKREYGSALHWLETAGIAMRSYNVSAPDRPLSGVTRADSFRVLMCDTGLLLSMCDPSDASAVVNRDPGANIGWIMENAIGSVLMKKGFRPRYYSKPDSTLEVDFVIDRGDGVTLIEVKSGSSRRSKSLQTLIDSSKDRKGIKLAESQISVDDRGIRHLPLYALCFFPDVPVPGLPVADVEGMNSRLASLDGHEDRVRAYRSRNTRSLSKSLNLDSPTH